MTAPVHRVEQVMGMPVTLALRGRHTRDRRADTAWSEVISSLRETDRLFSTYREDSEVSRIDRGELLIRDASSAVQGVLLMAEEASQASGGAFSVWRIDTTGRVRLDPDGIVKGWAVERASLLLQGLDDTDSCLSAGGDMVCRTTTDTAPGWRIGLEDPLDPARVLAILPVSNAAVATSGMAHRGAHIVDARTGLAPTGIASVTVVGASLTWADVNATTAFALGRDATTWLRSRTDLTAFVVHTDGTTQTVQTPAAAA